MHTQTARQKENKSLAAANPVAQKQSGSDSIFQFTDNRPEAGAQRHLQEIANNSPQARQATQLKPLEDSHSIQQQKYIQKENSTDLTNNQKQGNKNAPNYTMNDVNAHHKSDKPDPLSNHAYGQETDIRLTSSQERHSPHGAWQMVQKKQTSIKPTMQMKSKSVYMRGDSPESSLSSVAPIQRLTKQKEFNTTEGEKKEEAPPFQLATIQFEGTYDLNLYKSSLQDYMNRTPKSLMPIIELRAYDSAPPSSIDNYIEHAASVIQGWGVTRPFVLRYKTLRDEAMPPNKGEENVNGELEAQKQIGDLKELELGQEGLPDFLNHNPELMKPQAAMNAGNMMIPAPEFYELSALKDNDLNKIWRGLAAQKYSLHVRQIAKMILDSRQGTEERKEEPVGRLQRSNSTVKPDTLTMTNLVVGDEEMTQGVVIKAVKSAFDKLASQVLLTVEHAGYTKSKWGRISGQISLLREKGFRVEIIHTTKDNEGAKAQQSGIRKEEPTNTAPARSVLRITPETRKKLPENISDTIIKNGWTQHYIDWYCKMVKEDRDDAQKFMSVSGTQYLREMKGYV